MIPPKNKVSGKLRGVTEVNPKLYSTQCPPHRLILAAKGQRELPDDVEKTISDTLSLKTALSDVMNSKSLKKWLNVIVLMYQLSSITRCGGCL